MKNLFLTLLFLGYTILLSAQDSPKVGDAFIVKSPSSHMYNHVSFPKLNFLVKRGKLANYKSVYNNKVVVDEVLEDNDGHTHVILKKKDGSKFFGYLSKVKANLSKALASEELVKP